MHPQLCAGSIRPPIVRNDACPDHPDDDGDGPAVAYLHSRNVFFPPVIASQDVGLVKTMHNVTFTQANLRVQASEIL